MQTVLVLGAAGNVGRSVAAAFADAGWRVKGLVRPDGARRLPPAVEAVEADGGDRAALAAAGADADVVFHGLNPAYTRWEREMMALAEGAIAAAAANRAQLLLPGNVYNFGARMPDRLTPQAGFHPTTSKGRLRVELERRLKAAGEDKGFMVTILRAGDFFGGSRRGSWFDRVLVKDIADDRFTAPAEHGVPHAWAYLPDLAAAFVALAGARDRLGRFETFHFPGHTVSMDDWVDAVEAAVGHPVEVRRLPWRLLRLAGLVSPMMRALVEMKYLWDVPHGLVDDRLEPVIGEVPHTPFPRAVADALAALGHPVGKAR